MLANMDIIIEASHLPEFFISPWVIGLTILAGVAVGAAVLSAILEGDPRVCATLALLGAVSTMALLTLVLVGAPKLEQDNRASLMATISDQYGIADLEHSGGESIALCEPNSAADNQPYAWTTENPDTLYEGVMVKSAEKDGECSYTLYPKTSTTPPLGD